MWITNRLSAKYKEKEIKSNDQGLQQGSFALGTIMLGAPKARQGGLQWFYYNIKELTIIKDRYLINDVNYRRYGNKIIWSMNISHWVMYVHFNCS